MFGLALVSGCCLANLIIAALLFNSFDLDWNNLLCALEETHTRTHRAPSAQHFLLKQRIEGAGFWLPRQDPQLSELYPKKCVHALSTDACGVAKHGNSLAHSVLTCGQCQTTWQFTSAGHPRMHRKHGDIDCARAGCYNRFA